MFRHWAYFKSTANKVVRGCEGEGGVERRPISVDAELVFLWRAASPEYAL